MAIWHIVVLYLAIFALLQVVVYRYLRGRDDGTPAQLGSASNPDSGGLDDRRLESTGRGERRADGDEDGAMFCPECGTRNESEQMYTYCRNCLTRLGRG